MKLLVSCPSGLGSLLASELKRLKFQPFETFSRGTRVETDLAGMYTINLRSRLANKVYIQVASGEAKDFDQLFAIVKKSDYGQRTNNSNLSLKVTTHRSLLSAPRAIQSVAHKALLDSIVNFSRTESRTEELLLIIENNQASLLLNTSGASLHNRGYRTKAGLAPLKENLAAAMILLSSWRFKSPLIDPFCGSGTIAIEALLLAKNIAPGSQRSFAFERFRRYDARLWEEIKSQAQTQIFQGKYDIAGYDQDPQMIAIAKANAKTRGLERDLHFEVKKFEKADFGGGESNPAWILTNPPYGKRLQDGGLDLLYRELYSAYDQGYFGGVITSFEQVKPDLRARNSKFLFNGEDKCTFWYRKLS